eukprot:7249209-Pyramimonas_sp.AAC.1
MGRQSAPRRGGERGSLGATPNGSGAACAGRRDGFVRFGPTCLPFVLDASLSNYATARSWELVLMPPATVAYVGLSSVDIVWLPLCRPDAGWCCVCRVGHSRGLHEPCSRSHRAQIGW